MIDSALGYGFACYGLTDILVSAKRIAWLRDYVIKRSPLFRAKDIHLLECRYCTGFWVAIGMISLPYLLVCLLAIYGIMCFLVASERK